MKAPAFAGALAGSPLEDTTRRVGLDPLIAALGWHLEYDVAQEARVVADTTLFIDYLGVDRQTRDVEMIFEAKAWEVPMISATRANGIGPAGLAAMAIEFVRTGKTSTPPVTKSWMEKVSQLRDYVAATKKQTGIVVPRVAISSGQWIMIFRNPGATFLGIGASSGDDILVLQGEEMIIRSDDIYALLAREHLSDRPRSPIRGSELPNYLKRGAVPKAVYRALWIGHAEGGTEFKSKPSLAVHTAVLVERDDGALLQVVESNRDFDVPSNQGLIGDHLRAVAQASDELLASIAATLEIAIPSPSDIVDFPGFKVGGPRGERTMAVSSPGKSGNLLLVTGAASHYLRPEPEIAGCAFHAYAECLADGKALEPVISVRSYAPPSFFTTGEVHHCAHLEIYDEKETLPCPLSPVEERLCCRACTLQRKCWPDRRLSRFPCGKRALIDRAH